MSNPIERQAAIDAICEAFCYAYCDNCEKELDEDLCGDCHRKYQNWSASRKTVEKVINALPSAQPMRKKGKWIFHETENDRYDDMICPFCKTCYTVDAYRIDDIGFTAEDFNFCLACGADMRVTE